MKTYFRKNSSYLKKAFVASNFNEMCRLCLSEVDFLLVPIFQDRQIPYQELIQYSVDVLVEEGDGLPTSVCKECLGMVEKSYLFKKKCQMNDSKLREHLRLLDLNEESKMNERLEGESDSVLIESDDKKEIIPTFLQISNTNDQDKSTNDELNSPNLGEQSNAVDESSNANVADNFETSQHETGDEIVAFNYDGIAENNQEVQEVTRDEDDHYEVLNLPVYSKIKRYEREKSKLNNKKKETFVENKIDDTGKTETELIYLLSEDVQSMSSNCQNEPESSNIVHDLTSENDDNEFLQSREEVKSGTTIIKVYSIVESDSEEDMEVALGGRELVAKADRIEEIVELWDNDEDEITIERVKDDEEIKNGVSEDNQSEGNDFINEDWTDETAEKSDESFEVRVEENGVVKTREFFVYEKSDSLPSESSEETSVSGSKKTVVTKVFNKCSICNASFETRSEIKDHMFSKHKDSLDYCTCTVCFKNFSCPNSLKRHMLVHTGTKPYCCEICKRRFSQSSILKRHRFTHNEFKPYQCHFCKKSYTQKMNLLIHLRNHGFKGQKEKYKCNLCDKKFVHHSGLSRHLKLHKGEMSFCPLCNKSFTDSSAMLRHVRSIHKTDPLNS